MSLDVTVRLLVQVLNGFNVESVVVCRLPFTISWLQLRIFTDSTSSKLSSNMNVAHSLQDLATSSSVVATPLASPSTVEELRWPLKHTTTASV